MPRFNIVTDGDEEIQSRPPGDATTLEVELEDSDFNSESRNAPEPEFDDITPRRKKAKAEDVADEDELDADEISDEDEDEDELPKGKFVKRLARERRLLREARDELREYREENEHWKGTVLKKIKDADLEKLTADAEIKVNALRDQLEAAIEAGDTKKQAALTLEIADVKADIKAKEIEIKNAREAEVSKPQNNRVQRLAAQWTRKHQRFNSDPEFKALATAVDKQLISEGSDNSDDEHYEELDRRLAKRFPEEYKVKSKSRKPPIEDNGSDTPSVRTGRFVRRGNKIILSKSQIDNMRRFGLDPESKDDVTSYVKENMG